MFTPSLIAMMHHSLASQSSGGETESTGVVFGKKKGDNWELAKEIRELAKKFSGELPQIPTVGFTDPRFLSYALQVFKDAVVVDDQFGEEGRQFFWGRIPVDRLAEYFQEMHASPPDGQLIDFGTALRENGSGSAFDTTCKNLIAQTAKHGTGSVGVVIVDRGQTTAGKPEDYQGHLRLASQKLTLSLHAEKVLSVLLERLQKHGILADTELTCALVAEPALPVGRACFKHQNSVEMLTALKALRTVIARDKIPLAMNISMGTHCGPHNGMSPLEEYVSRLGDPKAQRFFHVAAGNDGLSGVAAVKTIYANEREFFQLHVEQGQSNDFLVEFWWHDPHSAMVGMDVTVRDPGNQQPLTNLSVNSGNVGRVLKKVPGAGFKSVVCKSLFHAQCRNQMSCITLALSTPASAFLPEMDIQVAVQSTADIVMHGWIVVSDARSMFIEGDSTATIMVPASSPGVISVAGVDDTGQPWAKSSRGPGAIYQFSTGVVLRASPMMAHLAALGSLGEYGTSYASPRACGDSAVVLKDPKRLQVCKTAKDLLFESYGISRTTSPLWSSRTGFKAVRQ